MKKKLKAFTIIELTITMLITAVLIGIAYASYSIIAKSYLDFNKKNTEITGLNILDHLLARDFEKADLIQKNVNGIRLLTGGRTISYAFYPSFIIRSSFKVDTIYIAPQNVVVAFENNPLNDAESNDGQNRIDELIFDVNYQNQKIPYHYFKLYSAVNLISTTTDAIN